MEIIDLMNQKELYRSKIWQTFRSRVNSASFNGAAHLLSYRDYNCKNGSHRNSGEKITRIRHKGIGKRARWDLFEFSTVSFERFFAWFLYIALPSMFAVSYRFKAKSPDNCSYSARKQSDLRSLLLLQGSGSDNVLLYPGLLVFYNS